MMPMGRLRFPWKWIIGRMAKRRGFLDPFLVLARMGQFGQPVETVAPIELMRSGMVLYARGMLNRQALQHNVDWIWPNWVARQFDPQDEAFIPWAFAVSHINLSFRNWTAVGMPDFHELPIVDPRGLVTPFLDGWSLDAAIVSASTPALIPSRQKTAQQRLILEGRLAVVTHTQAGTLELDAETDVVCEKQEPVCRIQWTGRSAAGAWLAVMLRPYNPEGVSFIQSIALTSDRLGWEINGRPRVRFSEAADRHVASSYQTGDVYYQLPEGVQNERTECGVGLATAAALFELKPGVERSITVTVPLDPAGARKHGAAAVPSLDWSKVSQPGARLQIPDSKIKFLYDSAVRSLLLHSPGEVYPGPYTYKHFWFRDAAFIIPALTCLGFTERAERALDRFPERQTLTGFFRSQEGEWDSNGQALWALGRFCELTGRPPKEAWRSAMLRAAGWIQRKRLPAGTGEPHAGLFPAGFSAEHFGPTDYYYWDDFWGVAGLQIAAETAWQSGDPDRGAKLHQAAKDFLRCTEESIRYSAIRLKQAAVPASPYRRLDAGAIGPLVAGYPLQIWAPDDPRLKATVEFLLRRCFLRDCFFQEISHSGLNAYLTLHVAQALLRSGDSRYEALMVAVAELASPTGQWPEAIHPRTLGGCMGDGQHVWASAEWVLLIRNLFVREEGHRLVLASGVPAAWTAPEGARISFGPTLTPFGEITVNLERKSGKLQVNYQARWHDSEPAVEVHLPGHPAVTLPAGQRTLEVSE